MSSKSRRLLSSFLTLSLLLTLSRSSSLGYEGSKSSREGEPIGLASTEYPSELAQVLLLTTEEASPTEFGRQTEEVTQGMYEHVVAAREELWTGPIGTDLYRLMFYQDLPIDPQERLRKLEPQINSDYISYLVVGFDGQEIMLGDQLNKRTKEFDQMNADAMSLVILHRTTGKITVFGIDRSLVMEGGPNFAGDGHVANRAALTSTEAFRVLGAQDPAINLQYRVGIMFGIMPDYVIGTHMDGFRSIMDKLEPPGFDTEEELSEIRDRTYDPLGAGNRSIKAIKFGAKLAKATLARDLPLIPSLYSAQFALFLNDNNMLYAPTGNPLDSLLDTMIKLKWDNNKMQTYFTELLESITYVQLTDAELELKLNESTGIKYYDNAALIAQYEEIYSMEAETNQTNDHLIPWLIPMQSETGHLLMAMIPAYRDQSGDIIVDWALMREGISLKDALADDNELAKLKLYWSNFRDLIQRYLEISSKL